MTNYKKIHYCWFGGAPLPKTTIKYIESWKKYCPGYEIVKWDESNFDCNICEYVKEAYERKRWAFVSDYARFWILYNYGGLYFDTDVELVAPINDLIRRGPFMGIERELDFREIENHKQDLDYINPGLGLYAVPGLDLYREVLDAYANRHFIDPNGRDDTQTIVEFVSKILSLKDIEDIDEISIKVGGVYFYKKDVFCPINYRTGKIEITKNTKSIHHYTASWMTNRELKIHHIYIKIKGIFGEKAGRILGGIITLPLRIRDRKIFISNLLSK